MKRLVKFLQLTWSDRFLLVTTAFLLGVIRLGLWLLPFQIVRRLLARKIQSTNTLHKTDQAYINRVVWAVVVASRFIPGVKCLAQALATQVLLSRRDCLTQLCIGVARGKKGQLLAHAWVETQGRLVIGGSGNMSIYTPLPLQELESYERDRWYLFSRYKAD